MNQAPKKTSTSERQKNIAYLIGTYPVLTTTFIDREIKRLREWGVNLQVVSIRRPQGMLSAEQRELQRSVVYLLPASIPALIAAHLYFSLFYLPIYFGTLFFLL